jgi:hypothetical protein
MQGFFLVSWALAVSVAMLPIVYFLVYGWAARESEFIDKVRVERCAQGQTADRRDGNEMDRYFDKFWSEGRDRYLDRHPADRDILRRATTALGQRPLPSPTFWGQRQPAAPVSWDGRPTEEDAAWLAAEALRVRRDLFRARYRELIAWQRYLLPAAQFCLVVAVLSGLAVATALRTGYDQYLGYVVGEATAEATAHGNHIDIEKPIHLVREDVDAVERALRPLPRIHLSLSTLSAIAGAYLFMVAQLVQQCRARTLVYSDLFGASLRLLLAVPVGLATASLANNAFPAPFIAFGLSAFPIRALAAIVRRLTAKGIGADPPGASDDQTGAMLGVTQSVSDVLAEENITCAQQLADIDPVLLALRTGLSFDYVLFLAAQSLVWCFLGKTAGALGPLGYGDARAIWFLINRTDSPELVFNALDALLDPTPPSARIISAPLLKQAFVKIAGDPYTLFLVDFTSALRLESRGPISLRPPSVTVSFASTG